MKFKQLYDMHKSKVNFVVPQVQVKQRHHWVCGPSNTGKTTRLRQFLTGKSEFQIPYNDDWNGYNKEEYLWIDEFKGQLTIQALNRICDGGAKMNTKGGSVSLHPYPTVIVCSNYSIEECFHKQDATILKSLHNRFNLNLI